jgi:hypothetical protein
VSKRKPPPLKSANWWPWGRAIEYVRERMMGDDAFMIAVNQGDVSVKIEVIDIRANPPTRVSKLLEDIRVGPWFDQVVIVSDAPGRPGNRAFFAWGPDLQRIWPTERPATNEPSADKTRDEGPPEYELIREIAAEEFPGGYKYVGTAKIMKAVGDELKRRGLPVPKRDAFLRALGRR